MIKNILTIIILVVSLSIQVHTETYRVYFKDKEAINLTPGSQDYQLILSSLDDKAIKRREINFNSENILTSYDIPISKNYINQIESLGFSIIAKVKWFNYVVIEGEDVTALKDLDFVLKSEDVRSKIMISDLTANCGEYEYGFSYNQLDMLKVPEIHKLGINGSNSRIGFIDSGFNWLEHEATENTNVLLSYDFINRDSLVWDEQGDISGQDDHGSVVMAAVTGKKNGLLIGVSPESEILLAKTENLGSETSLELDHFIEAVIWMEQKGVDIINTSLGYRYMDTLSYEYEDMDGSSNLASRAYNIASQFGVICVNSIGNNGDNPETLNIPADADSAIAVGAVNPAGDNLVGFSSNGPNSRGNIKPELVAQGANVVSIDPNSRDLYGLTGGTSLSSPLVAGFFSILKSLYPHLKSYEIKNAVFETSNNFNTPDNRFGYGIPDIMKAMEKLGPALSEPNYLDNGDFVRVLFKVINPESINYAEIVLNDIYGESIFPPILNGDELFFDVSKERINLGLVQFNIKYVDSENVELRKPYSENKFYEIIDSEELIRCGINLEDIVITNPSTQVSPVILNPTLIRNNMTTVSVKIEKFQNIDIKVFDISGRIVYDSNQSYGPGIFQKSIDLGNLVSGSYFLQVLIDNNKFKKQLIIIK